MKAAPTAKAMVAARTALAGHRTALAPSNIISGSPSSQRKASPPPEAAAPASAPAVDPDAWAEEEESLAVAERTHRMARGRLETAEAALAQFDHEQQSAAAGVPGGAQPTGPEHFRWSANNFPPVARGRAAVQ